MTEDEKRIKIRELNDQLRKTGKGGRVIAVGSFGQSADEFERIAVAESLRRFVDFDDGNDPYGEHDFGRFTVARRDYIFKIDYYALDEQHGSEHPEDPNVTVRVLSVFYAEDY